MRVDLFNMSLEYYDMLFVDKYALLLIFSLAIIAVKKNYKFSIVNVNG